MSGRTPWRAIHRRSAGVCPICERHARIVKWCALGAGALLLAALLAGCATTSHTVEVPVPVPCEVPDVPKPALPIDAVPLDADIFAKVRALIASVELLEGDNDRLRAAIVGCAK